MNVEIEKAICTVSWFTKGFPGAELAVQAIEAHIRELTEALKPLATVDTDVFRDSLNRVRPDHDFCKEVKIGDIRRARKALGWNEEWPT